MTVLDKAIMAAMTYLEGRGFEHVERLGNYVTGLDDGARVFAKIRTVRDDFLPIDEVSKLRSEFEHVAIMYFMEHGTTPCETRFDDIQMVVTSANSAFIRHNINCINTN